MYNKSDLEEIKKRIDLVEYLEQRGTTLRPAGTSYVGLCPVHSERSPSFHVRPDTQTFRCFGCGISGDCFSLIQAMDALTFSGAVQELAQYAGVTLKFEEDPDYERRKRLYGILSLASQWFRRNYLQLEVNHIAKQNLADRNLYEYSLTDNTIGYAGRNGLIALMTERGITIDELIEVGLVVMSQETNEPRERFRNRLIWTITDIQGRPIGFSARKLYPEDMGAKYINTPATEFYNKSKTLLGLADAKKTIISEQTVYVVEGQADVMAMKAAGFINTVASCGTAFGTEHANILLHLSNMGRDAHKFRIVFCFDGDAAGTKAANSVFQNNQRIHMNSHVVQFANQDGTPTDPCDYRKDYGDVALQNLVRNQEASLVEFVLTEELKKWDMTSPEGQSAYLSQARMIVDKVTDQIQRSAYVRKLATWTGIPHSEIISLFNRRQPHRETPQEAVSAPVTPQETDIVPAESKVLATLLQHPVEAYNVVTRLGLDSSYFNTAPDLVQIILQNLNGSLSDLDLNDQRIVQLLHADTGVVEGRTEEGVTSAVTSYLKYRYTQEINKMHALNLNFAELLFKQEELRKYYRQ